ncbi:MAG: 3' terminal RNA ribose 2'-O-methyltransferase Hen1 [Actinomycetota bacterium]|nr:3' terminal RNA ribose 2'-O-methyltransferase Hen1 [Actinomycetota bacterium]
MLLTISTDHRPATDLGYLLHKNPSAHHRAELGFGRAHVVYPEASNERCTAAVVVDVDPVGLVRRRAPRGHDFSLGQYVNDRPYATSSFMSVALGKVFSTAMAGRSKERPELVEQAIALEVSLPVTPCRGGEDVAHRLFEPLGYEVTAQAIPLDPRFPQWGDSQYVDLTLTATVTLKGLLEHLVVLLPVLDDDKHYWVGPDEIDKLLRRGGDWLSRHPERELITRRYLRHDRRLTREALGRLMEEDLEDPDEAETRYDAREHAVERPIHLNERRLEAVLRAVRASGARRVLDLGCGEGKLIGELLRVRGIEQVVGVDVSSRMLDVAAQRLHLDTMAPSQRARVDLLHGSLTYRDARLVGFDAAAVAEVIEHLDPSRLGSFERAVFAHARPSTVIVTTPNIEYNVRFESLPAGALRHRDHRFEWTRAELANWCAQITTRHGYTVALSGIGPEDATVGPPTQMAVFSR